MKIALAQINTTVGDFSGNVRKIVDYSRRARALNAELCLFPEQCLPGYPSHDLLERSRFIEDNLQALDDAAQQIRGIGVVVGFAEPHSNPVGKGLFNSAALIDDGKVQSVHRKVLLPAYDIFDEARYFDPGEEVKPALFRNHKIGITICEDVWNDPDFWSKRLYRLDPGSLLKAQGASFIVNISASPFTLTKRKLRREMLQAYAKHLALPLIVVNLVGGNDDLIFDGASVAFDSTGKVWAQGSEFTEELIIVAMDAPAMALPPLKTDDDEAALEALALGVRDYAHKCGFRQAVLGLSGGIDSALVAAVGAKALGSENIEAWLMPSRYSSPGSVTDALELVKNLGLSYRIVSIDSLLDSYLTALKPILGDDLGVTEENIQARIRGNLLMANSNFSGRLLLTTGNKSELATGYCTLYGDMAGGLAVLSDVPKTMVFQLAEVINREREIIPRAVIEKPPSAELRHDQKDSDSLPPYEILDPILDRHIVGGLDFDAITAEGFNPEVVDRILNLVRRNEYKRRQAPPGLKLTTKAFGFGRRMPMAQRWRP
ncbi:MAG: NAD+ synthase [Calditrichota bacterium]